MTYEKPMNEHVPCSCALLFACMIPLWQVDPRALGTLCSALLAERPSGGQVLGIVTVLRVARTRGLWTNLDTVRPAHCHFSIFVPIVMAVSDCHFSIFVPIVMAVCCVGVFAFVHVRSTRIPVLVFRAVKP